MLNYFANQDWDTGLSNSSSIMGGPLDCKNDGDCPEISFYYSSWGHLGHTGLAAMGFGLLQDQKQENRARGPVLLISVQPQREAETMAFYVPDKRVFKLKCLLAHISWLFKSWNSRIFPGRELRKRLHQPRVVTWPLGVLSAHSPGFIWQVEGQPAECSSFLLVASQHWKIRTFLNRHRFLSVLKMRHSGDTGLTFIPCTMKGGASVLKYESPGPVVPPLSVPFPCDRCA